MHSGEDLFRLVEDELASLKLDLTPARLYEPIRYMIGIGGKRLRPVLMLMSNELFSGIDKKSVKVASALEVFHNFTLLHDDIMDKAPLRRAKETVHKKWNPDVAILSGDTMFVLACQMMMSAPAEKLNQVLEIFFRSAIDVCEGQQCDMDYETMNDVTIDDYLEMIGKKTAALIGCSTQIGAICGGAEISQANLMYEFGSNLGLAFQLHDDILDVYGDADKFGKQLGGDILSNKKTFLLLSALENSDPKTNQQLNEWLSKTNFDPSEKISAVKGIYEKLGIRSASEEKMTHYFRLAMDTLDKVDAPSFKKDNLYSLSEKIMVREK